MLKHRFKLFAAVSVLVLTLLVLFALTSCGGHKHSWSAWEIYDGIESRYCQICGEIETNGGQITPPVTTPPVTTPPVTTPPVTTPSTTTPPATTPPATTPPATTPPVTTPPATTPPETTPPTTTEPVAPPAPHEHSFVNYVPNGDASCTSDGTKTAKCEGCDETDTVTDVGSKKAHSFLNYVSNGDASCTSDGTKTAKCESCDETDTVTDVSTKKAHVFLNYVPNGDASCTADGTKTAKCEGCDETDVKADLGSMTDHETETVTVAPGCTEQGSVKTSCIHCDYENVEYTDPVGHRWSAEAPTCTDDVHCLDCGEVKAQASGHSYGKTGSTDATCTEGATETYTCSGCADFYTETISAPSGHTVADWGTYVETVDGKSACIRYHVFTATCSACSETVGKTEGPFEKHTVSATIADGDAATCQKSGYKTYTCSVPGCGHTYKEEYTDLGAHTWVKDDAESTASVTVYTCACGESKRVIAASGENSNSATVDSTTLGEIGAVELEDATIELDSSTTGALSGNVNISADTVAPNAIPGMNDDLLAQIGDNKVYNFGLTANGEAVHEFSGKVTVRIPYELSDGEDPDCIAIWYIDDAGKVSTYEAVYSNGYAVFETDHFSYYTVTRLSAEERCALYGHTWDDRTYAATCMTDGYTLHVCLRCGESYRDQVIVATGHKMKESITPASCTKAGETLSYCENCSYSYSVRIPALGHSYGVTDTREASCSQTGYTVYTCASCSVSYRVTVPQLPHAYTDTVTAPSCVRPGYTAHTCDSCGHSYISDRTAPVGHSFKTETKAASCTEDGYVKEVCETCGESYLLSVTYAHHVWDILEPTCGKGQICTECGASGAPATGRHKWNIALPTCSEGQICTACGASGAPATGEHFWDLETPTCVQGQTCLFCGTSGAPATGEHTLVNGVCSVCGEGNCTHAFDATVTAPSCTEGGYTTYLCSSCGYSYVDDETEPTGHSYVGDVCTVCGNERAASAFYAEILKSVLASEGKTVRLTNLSGLPMLNGRRVEFAEVLLKLDGEKGLVGYGSCDVFDGATGQLREGLDAVLLDGTIYVLLKEGGAEMTYMKIDLEYLLGGDVGMILETLKWVDGELVPLLLEVIEHNAEAIGTALSEIVGDLFIRETLDDGSIRFTADAEAMAALVKTLSETTVGELLGESGRLAIESIPDLTVGALIDKAAELGFTVERLIPVLDKLAPMLSGGYATTLEAYIAAMMELGEFDLEAFLADEELLAMTVGDLIAGARGVTKEDVADMIAAYVEPMYEMNPFDLLAGLFMSFGGSNNAPDGGYEDGPSYGDSETTSIPVQTTSPTDAVPEDGKDSGKLSGMLSDEKTEGNEPPKAEDGESTEPSNGDRIAELLTSLAESLYISFTTDASGKLSDLVVSTSADTAQGTTLAILSGLHTELDYDALKLRISGYVDLPFLSSTNVSAFKGEGYTIDITRDENGKILSITVSGSESKFWSSGYGEYYFSSYNPSYPGIDLDGDGKPDYAVTFDGKEPAMTTAPELDPPKEEIPEDGKTEDGKTEDGKTEDGNPEDGKPEEGKPEETGRYYTADYVTAFSVTYTLSGASMTDVSFDCGDWLRILCGAQTHRTERSFIRVCYYDKEGGELLETLEGDERFGSEWFERDTLTCFYDPKTAELLLDVNRAGTMHEYFLDEKETSYATTCNGTTRLVHTCKVCGEKDISEWEVGHLDTERISELLPGAVSCNGGVLLKTVCHACGETVEETVDYGHIHYIEKTVNAETVSGLCGHHKLHYHGCLCGEQQSYYDLGDLGFMTLEILYLDANGVLSAVRSDSTVGEKRTYSCPDCALVITEIETYAKNGCTVITERNIRVTLGGELLFPEIKARYEEGQHKWETEANLLPGATSCYEGVSIYSYCTVCGESEKEYVSYDHNVHDQSLIDLKPYGVDGEVRHGTCACGEFYNDAYLSVDGYVYLTEMGINGKGHKIYQNKKDGDMIALCLTETKAGCTRSRSLSVLFGFDMKDGSSASESASVFLASYESHDYVTYGSLVEGATSCEDGVLVYDACLYCGKRAEYENGGEGRVIHWHETLLVKACSLLPFGVDGFITIQNCACGSNGIGYGASAPSWSSEGGENYYRYNFYDDSYELLYTVTVIATCEQDRESCTETCTSVLYFGYDPEDGSYDAEDVVDVSTRKHHAESRSFVSLLPGSTTCYDGMHIVERCVDCGEIIDERDDSYHYKGVVDVIDLTQYGATSGELFVTGCACGADSRWLEYKNEAEWEHEDHSDGKGYIFDLVRISDGYRIRIKEESVLDGCLRRYYKVLYFNYSVEDQSYDGIYRYEHSMPSEEHDLVERATLADGAVSCDDGVTITRSCTRCTWSDTYSTKDHTLVVVETIDLSAPEFGMGAACGGKVYVRSCACDYYQDVSFDTKCEFQNQGMMIGDKWGELYTCAVTDPACSFRWAFTHDQTQAPGSCHVFNVMTVHLGCDRDGLNAARVITLNQNFKNHDWETVDTATATAVPCYYQVSSVNRCKNCGETFGEWSKFEWRHELDASGHCQNTGCDRCLVYTYDSNGCLVNFYGVNYEVYGDVTVAGGYELERYVDEVRYTVKNGRSLETYSYRKNEFVIGRDGWNSYSTWEYTYSFEGVGKCYRTGTHKAYEMGELYEEYTSGPDCICEWDYDKQESYLREPSCSQPGTWISRGICWFCGVVVNEYESECEPLDHDWCYDENTGDSYCSRCDLRGQNGASGNIVLEELASEDGDKIRIGYWNRYGISFTVSVGAKLHTPDATGNDELYLRDFEVSLGETVISLSRGAVVKALAEQYGVSADAYDIRITLVGEGLSDYGITLN